jgi:hypothetical protein
MKLYYKQNSPGYRQKVHWDLIAGIYTEALFYALVAPEKNGFKIKETINKKQYSHKKKVINKWKSTSQTVLNRK